MTLQDTDTISAIATPAGRGGIGIVRVSGPSVMQIALAICGRQVEARVATYCQFRTAEGKVLDSGIALFFPGPKSFTGEDVLELQGHGGVVVLKSLLRRTLECGARMARPGEFTERAFLNDKLDLLQAEATADLISATSEQAMRSSVRTLQGAFSAHIHALVKQITAIRVNVEAAIDFSDDAIDLLRDTEVAQALQDINTQVKATYEKARQGALLQEGIAVVLAGAPNAGKSTLLNALAGSNAAIVTDIPGTTRDLLRQQLDIDGLPVSVTDTAGLRASQNPVEMEGIRRARDAVNQADQVLLVVDASLNRPGENDLISQNLDLLALDNNTTQWIEQYNGRLCLVLNKIDLIEGMTPGQGSTVYQQLELPSFHISAQQGEGLDNLRSFLKNNCGYDEGTEDVFIARERHIQALKIVAGHLENAGQRVSECLHLELVAEELRLGQQALSAITGVVTSDDLLGEIFANFCLGK